MAEDCKLIIFDWDGTLMDSGDRIARCFIQSARDVGLDPPEAGAVKRYIGVGLAVMFENLCPGVDEARIAQLVARYREHWLSRDSIPTPLFPGVREGLARLGGAGYLLSVATGKSRAGLDRSLQSTGLGPHFTFTRCADEARAKPHPRMLLDILEHTGVAPGAAVMIGDTTFDMQMARSAGVPSLGVGHGYHGEGELQALSEHPVQGSFDDIVRFFTPA